MLRQSARALVPADRLSDRCRPGMLPSVDRGCRSYHCPHPVDVRVLCCPGGLNTLSGSLDLDGVRVSGSADPCKHLLAGPRLRLAVGRDGVPVLLSEAVPYDHSSPQDLSVLAILSLRLCLGPTVG